MLKIWTTVRGGQNRICQNVMEQNHFFSSYQFIWRKKPQAFVLAFFYSCCTLQLRSQFSRKVFLFSIRTVKLSVKIRIIFVRNWSPRVDKTKLLITYWKDPTGENQKTILNNRACTFLKIISRVGCSGWGQKRPHYASDVQESFSKMFIFSNRAIQLNTLNRRCFWFWNLQGSKILLKWWSGVQEIGKTRVRIPAGNKLKFGLAKRQVNSAQAFWHFSINTCKNKCICLIQCTCRTKVEPNTTENSRTYCMCWGCNAWNQL